MDDKMNILRAQALADAGLPMFPPAVVEQLERRRNRQMYWRWGSAKVRIRAFWAKLLAPWNDDRLNPLDDALPRLTHALLVKVVGTIAGMNEDSTRIKEHQKRQFELLWGAIRLLAQSQDLDIVKELKSESKPGEIDDGAKADIAELQRLLGLSGPDHYDSLPK